MIAVAIPTLPLALSLLNASVVRMDTLSWGVQRLLTNECETQNATQWLALYGFMDPPAKLYSLLATSLFGAAAAALALLGLCRSTYDRD